MATRRQSSHQQEDSDALLTRLAHLRQTEAALQGRVQETQSQIGLTQAEITDVLGVLREHRRYSIGLLAEQRGLADWPDSVLDGVFGLLATLKDVPNPVALLEGLLAEHSPA